MGKQRLYLVLFVLHHASLNIDAEFLLLMMDNTVHMDVILTICM